MDLTNDENGPEIVKQSEWQKIAVWALISLLGVGVYFTNRQFDTIDDKLNVLQTAVTTNSQSTEGRLSALETDRQNQEILLNLLLKTCN